MILKSTKFISLLLAGIVGITTLICAPTTLASENVCSKNSNVAQEVKDAAGCGESGNNLPNAVIIILNGIIGVAGLVAVVFVVIGGFQYMTSAGDPSKTKKAKDTILYAVIGLIICALAFAIVNFVTKNIIK